MKDLLRLLYHNAKNPAEQARHLNYYRYRRRVLRNPQVNYTPPVFIATITENCNLRCPPCLYVLQNPDKFFKSFIGVEKFRGILEKYNKKRKTEVIFLTGGEPLLHPRFDELVHICRDYNMAVKTSTNGLLVKDNILSLIKLDYINVSVDSYDYDSFYRYRGGTPKQYEMLKESLKILKGSRVNFSMSFLISEANVSEMPRMIEFAEFFRPTHIYFHNINPHGCEQYKPLTSRGCLDEVLGRDDYRLDIHISYIFDTKSPSFLRSKCIQPWYYFCFNSVGDISFCCHLEHDSEIGNWLSYDFNSPRMVDFRNDIISGKIMNSCLYCQRRFTEDGEFAFFDSSQGKWSELHNSNN